MGWDAVPVVSIKVMPRTRDCSVSVSRYVAEAVKVLEEHGLKPMVTPDTTVFRLDDISMLGGILKDIHERLKSIGAMRILTLVMVDERIDKPERDPEDLVDSVLKNL